MKKPFLFRAKIPVFCAVLTGAAQNDPGEWVRYAENQIRGNASLGQYQMKIVTPEWTRELELESKTSGKDRALVFIQSPPKEKGIGTLRLDGRMTNYFPKLKRTVEVSPSMLLTSWMGSDFTNDDLLKASSLFDDYNHKFIGKTKIDNEELRIIENNLKNNAKAIWPKITYFVSPKDCLPRKQEYFDNTGALVRTLKFSSIKKFDGHLVPSVWVMKQAQEKDKETQLIYKDVKYNVTFPATDFSLKALTK